MPDQPFHTTSQSGSVKLGPLHILFGVYHFLADRTPGDIDIVPPRPRKQNPFSRDGMALVSKVKAGQDLKSSIVGAVDLIGGLAKAVSPGDSVLLKPNFNSAAHYPGSTDLEFLRAVIEVLLEARARVTVGESSGGVWRPTRKILEKTGVLRMVTEMGAEVVAFEHRKRDWVKVRVDGDYLKEVTVPRSAYEADKIIYLPCMKTHQLARFTLSLKLAVGFMHPGERRCLHFRNLEHKIAEISLVWQPDLIIMDGRKIFISGGPEKGDVEEPGIIMASGDLVAIDVEALKIMGSYKAKNRLLPNPYDSPQIATALRHGLGSKEYKVIE